MLTNVLVHKIIHLFRIKMGTCCMQIVDCTVSEYFTILICMHF